LRIGELKELLFRRISDVCGYELYSSVVGPWTVLRTI
jgi:hypothetical protein